MGSQPHLSATWLTRAPSALSPMDVFPATSLMVLPPVDMVLRSLMACCSEVGSLQSSSAEVIDAARGQPAQAVPVGWHGPLLLP